MLIEGQFCILEYNGLIFTRSWKHNHIALHAVESPINRTSWNMIAFPFISRPQMTNTAQCLLAFVMIPCNTDLSRVPFYKITFTHRISSLPPPPSSLSASFLPFMFVYNFIFRFFFFPISLSFYLLPI